MAGDKKLVEGKYLMYQGKPLVREDNTIIYGDLNNDPCVMVLEVMTPVCANTPKSTRRE